LPAKSSLAPLRAVALGRQEKIKRREEKVNKNEE